MASRDFRPPEEKTSPVLFFIMGLLMVAVTFWAVWDEAVSRRPWKEFQKNFNDFEQNIVEKKLTEARKKNSKEVSQIKKQIAALEKKLAASRELKDLRSELERLKLVAFEKVQDLAFAKAIFDQALFELNEGIRQGHDVSEERKHLEEFQKEIDVKKPIADKAEAARDAVHAKIQGKLNPLNDLKKQLRDVDQLPLNLERRLKGIESRPYEIKQIVLREFDRNNFNEPVYRVDRCQTCHLGINRAEFEKGPPQFRTHPNRGLYLGKHNLSEVGCVSCHGGQGSALKSVRLAHGFDHFWDDPLLSKSEVESKCYSCHASQFNIREAPSLSKGISLVRELGCFGCHTIPGTTGLRKRGPDLSRIREKVNPGWLVSWIKRPKDYNPRTKMPYFSLSEGDSRDMATYLLSASQRKAGQQKIEGLGEPATIEKGKALFESVGCLACHIRDEKDLNPGPKLKGVDGWPIVFRNRDFAPALGKIALKVQADWLVRWLKNPASYWHETTMPSLRLSDGKSKSIAAYLLSLSPPPGKISSPLKLDDKASFDRGEKLLRERGCPGCHVIPGLETAAKIGPDLTRFATKKPFELAFGNVVDIEHTWDAWTFAKLKNPKIYQTPRLRLLMPNFDLSDGEAAAIRTFLRAMVPHGPPESVHRNLDEREQKIENGRRMIEKYNCTGCHIVENWGGDLLRRYRDRNNGPPSLNGQGAKVQPSWFFGFLQNVVTLRPWLKVRMPSFQMPDQDVAALVDYFTALEGNLQPYVHFDKTKVAPESVKAARELIQKAECLSCHGAFPPPPGKEPPSAPNLSLAQLRLRPDWIFKWIVNPQKIQPGTKMPVFFEGAGRKANILGAKRGEQEDGRWTYTLNAATEAELPEGQAATLRIGPRSFTVKVVELDEKNIKISSPIDLGPSFGRSEIESHGEPIDGNLLGGDGYRQIGAIRDFLMSQRISSLPAPKPKN